DVPPAAAGGKTAEPAEALPQGNGGQRQIRQPEKVDPVSPRIDEGGERGADETAVKHQAAPDAENLREVGLVALPIDDDEEHPRADDPANQHPERQIHHLFPLALALFSPPLPPRQLTGQRYRADKATRQ